MPNLAIQDTFDSEIVGVLPLGTCIKGKKKGNWVLHDKGWSMIVDKKGKHLLKPVYELKKSTLERPSLIYNNFDDVFKENIYIINATDEENSSLIQSRRI